MPRYNGFDLDIQNIKVGADTNVAIISDGEGECGTPTKVYCPTIICSLGNGSCDASRVDT